MSSALNTIQSTNPPSYDTRYHAWLLPVIPVQTLLEASEIGGSFSMIRGLPLSIAGRRGMKISVTRGSVRITEGNLYKQIQAGQQFVLKSDKTIILRSDKETELQVSLC